MNERHWSSIPREDLNKIPQYASLGWVAIFHENDIRAGRTTPDKVPHEAASYSKKNVRIWQAIGSYKDELGTDYANTIYWVAADLIDGSWINHRKYATLGKAIAEEEWNMILPKNVLESENETKVFKADLSPNNHCGDVEYGKCEYCGTEAPLSRKYYYYPIRCDCHSPQHFELVRYCKSCEPKEPSKTMVCTHKEDGSQWNILIPTSIFINKKHVDE